MKMPLEQPYVTTEENVKYIRWGHLRYWVDDLNEATIECVDEECESVGVTDSHDLLEAEIDACVDARDGAEAVYLDRKKWEDA